MKHRIIVLLALGSASASALFFSACGGSDNTNVDGGSDATTNDVATNDAPVGDTGNNDTGTNDAGGGGDGACAPGPGCRQCCQTAYPDASAFFLATEEVCACTTPGDCKTACGNTLCTGKTPSGPCQACLFNKDAGDCFATTAATCLADNDCKPLAQCVASCGNGGPTDAGGGG